MCDVCIRFVSNNEDLIYKTPCCKDGRMCTECVNYRFYIMACDICIHK